MKASVLLLPLVLAEALAGRVAYRKRGMGMGIGMGRSQVQRKPNYALAFANLKTVPNPFYYALRRSYETPAAEEENPAPNVNQEPFRYEGYIPVTDGNGQSYLLLKSAIQDEEPQTENNPEPEEEEEQELLVPNGSIEIVGGQVVDSKTGQNSFILPEEVLNDVGDDDVVALVENPDDIEASRKFVIRRIRRRRYMPNRRAAYYPQPTPYYTGNMHGNVMQFGPVQVVTANGRRRIIFQ